MTVPTATSFFIPYLSIGEMAQDGEVANFFQPLPVSNRRFSGGLIEAKWPVP